MSISITAFTPLGLVNLSDEPKSSEIPAILKPAKNDSERAWYVDEINRQAAALGGWTFRLRFDQTLPNKDIRRRIFVRKIFIPGMSGQYLG